MIASWIMLAVATAAAVELSFRVPFFRTLRDMLALSRKAARIVVNKRVSDHWKEKALPRIGFRILFSSLMLLVWIVVIFAPLMAIVVVGRVAGNDPTPLIVSVEGTLVAIVLAVLLVFIRRRLDHV